MENPLKPGRTFADDEAGMRIHGFTLLGGEPFEPENQRGNTAVFAETETGISRNSVGVDTGFVLEDLMTEGTDPHCGAEQ